MSQLKLVSMSSLGKNQVNNIYKTQVTSSWRNCAAIIINLILLSYSVLVLSKIVSPVLPLLSVHLIQTHVH